jgi:hypothetical protein
LQLFAVNVPGLQCDGSAPPLRRICSLGPDPSTCYVASTPFLTDATAAQLALTAASPFWRGYIADVDSRWDVVAASVDDRTEEERGLKVRNSGYIATSSCALNHFDHV